nr:unnamed protein product [uncultured bacterium]
MASAYQLSQRGVSSSAIAAMRQAGTVSDSEHGGMYNHPYLVSSRAGSSSSGSGRFSSGSALDDYFSRLQSITASNNAWSAAQAQKQMDFQASQGALVRQFNHDEAELSRLWQERMSNTAHQREIKDLQAAGLNPVLSAMGGSGAPVTSGSTASGYSPPSGSKGDTDTSLAGALVSLLGSSMMAQASMANTAMSARTQESVADKYTAMSKLVAEIQQETTLSASTISAMASRYAADRSADASKVAASIHAAAQRYGYDVQAMTQRDIASFNAQVNKDLAQMGYQHDFDIKEAYPSSMAGLMASLFGESILGNDKGLSGLSDLWPTLKDLWSGRSSYGGGAGRSGR